MPNKDIFDAYSKDFQGAKDSPFGESMIENHLTENMNRAYQAIRNNSKIIKQAAQSMGGQESARVLELLQQMGISEEDDDPIQQLVEESYARLKGQTSPNQAVADITSSTADALIAHTENPNSAVPDPFFGGEPTSQVGSKDAVKDEMVSKKLGSLLDSADLDLTKEPWEQMPSWSGDEGSFNLSDIMRIIKKESSGIKSAYNKKSKASGLMQLLPDTAREQMVKLGLNYEGKKPSELSNAEMIYALRTDPELNIKLGSNYLEDLKTNLKTEDKRILLAGYNWGPENVKKALRGKELTFENLYPKLPKETKDYIEIITGIG